MLPPPRGTLAADAGRRLGLAPLPSLLCFSAWPWLPVLPQAGNRQAVVWDVHFSTVPDAPEAAAPPSLTRNRSHRHLRAS